FQSHSCQPPAGGLLLGAPVGERLLSLMGFGAPGWPGIIGSPSDPRGGPAWGGSVGCGAGGLKPPPGSLTSRTIPRVRSTTECSKPLAAALSAAPPSDAVTQTTVVTTPLIRVVTTQTAPLASAGSLYGWTGST